MQEERMLQMSEEKLLGKIKEPNEMMSILNIT
jgi:hypothetical protein